MNMKESLCTSKQCDVSRFCLSPTSYLAINTNSMEVVYNTVAVPVLHLYQLKWDQHPRKKELLQRWYNTKCQRQ